MLDGSNLWFYHYNSEVHWLLLTCQAKVIIGCQGRSLKYGIGGGGGGREPGTIHFVMVSFTMPHNV